MSLIGWWPLHEQSGQANDLSGNSNDGTVNGVTQGVWGRGGLTGYSFDGSDDYIDATVAQPDEMTVSVWVYGIPDGGASVAWNRTASSSYAWIIGMGDRTGDGNYDDIRVFGKDSDGNTIITSVDDSAEEWTHVSFTYANGTWKFYANGSLYKTVSDDRKSGLDEMRFGEYYNGASSSGDFFKGSLCDARIYDRALSPQEIQTLYEWGSGDYTDQTLHDGTDSGAVSRYEFNGDVTDSWGSNDGTDNTSAGFPSGIRGGAKGFDGTDYVDVGDIPSTTGINELTISAWINGTLTDGNEHIFVSKNVGGSSDNNSWALYVFQGELRFITYDSNDFSNFVRATADSSLSFDDEWLHVTGVSTTSENIIYVNGVKRDSSPASYTINESTTDINIGRNEAPGSYHSGEIDDVRIYDRALSDTEVHQLYRWGAQGRDLRQRLVKQ